MPENNENQIVPSSLGELTPADVPAEQPELLPDRKDDGIKMYVSFSSTPNSINIHFGKTPPRKPSAQEYALNALTNAIIAWEKTQDEKNAFNLIYTAEVALAKNVKGVTEAFVSDLLGRIQQERPDLYREGVRGGRVVPGGDTKRGIEYNLELEKLNWEHKNTPLRATYYLQYAEKARLAGVAGMTEDSVDALAAEVAQEGPDFQISAYSGVFHGALEGSWRLLEYGERVKRVAAKYPSSAMFGDLAQIPEVLKDFLEMNPGEGSIEKVEATLAAKEFPDIDGQ